MSAPVHRDRVCKQAHRITVEDVEGHQLQLVATGPQLEIHTGPETPRLTPQMAHDLADELHQWATTQQTRRSQRQQHRQLH